MEVPEGIHEIKFEFIPKVINTGFYFSILSYLIFMIVFVKFILLKKNV